MSLFSRGIVAAMEDEMANQELAIDEAGADSMEADLVETVDLAADIDSGTNEMEQTVKDADQLERHVEVLTDAEGEGGASPELIEATEIAVEGIYNRLGIYGGTGIPALESFSTKSGRRRYTAEAIDEIKKKIKSIWEAVVNAFKRLVNYIKDFFGKMWDANKKMLARINTLRSKAKSIKGTAKDKIKGSGISNVVSDLTPEGPIKNSNITAANRRATAIANIGKGFIEAVESDEKYSSFVLPAVNEGAEAKAKGPEGMVWKVVFEIGGNKIIHLVPKEENKGEKAFETAAKYSVKVESGDKKEGGEIAPLSQEDINKMLTAVEATVNVLLKEKANIAALQATLDQSIAKINSIISQTSSDDKDAGKRSGKVRSAVSSTVNGACSLISKVGSETTRVCQAYLTYVERSIDAYSVDNEKDKK